MRRVTGAMLFGLGFLCVIAAGVLVWLIVPTVRQVPYKFKPSDVVVEAPGATFIAVQPGAGGTPQVGVHSGTLRNRTGIIPDVNTASKLTGKLAGKTLIWNVYQKTDWAEANVPVSLSESRIALDRRSGAAVPWDGQCYLDQKTDTGCKPGNIAFSGQLYLFPFGTEKKTYQYWDSTLRTALPMQYRGSEKVAGLPTYRFEQTVPLQTLPADKTVVDGLRGFLAPGSHSATMTYQDTRTLWVEPMTGAIVAYSEQQHRQLVPDVGAPVDLVNGTFRYDPATAKTIVRQSTDGRSQLLLLGRYLPLGLLLIGLVAGVFGVLVTRRATAPGAHAVDRVPEPEPTTVPHA